MARVLSFQKNQTAVSAEKVGENLLRLDLITRDQLAIALHEQERSGKMLGAILVELGFLDAAHLASVLAERTGFASVDLATAKIDTALLELFPRDVLERCCAIPLRRVGDAMEIAIADPYDVIATDELRRHAGTHIQLAPFVAPELAIIEALARHLAPADEFDEVLRDLQKDNGDTAPHRDGWVHPVVRLVDGIIGDAVRRHASDVHFEPESNYVRLRYRIDGVMRQIRILHRSHWPEISHRIKIMAGMNIADTRSIQDGRFDAQIDGTTIDFRAAVMPTVQGENIVVRILDHRKALLPLDKLGFNRVALQSFDRLLQKPEGIMLVTGPTGSGKTTTLYSMLTKIRSPDVNIMTLEEPVEYQFDMIRQTSVQENRGLTFAEGVRGILRQAPDIIFIGEVRDPDTAQMALRAAMTGHQVFTTLHCNDALGALPRLIDLGLTPRMLSGNITGVVAQRLVRKLCVHCRTTRAATAEEADFLVRHSEATIDLKAYGFAEKQAAFHAAEPMVHDAPGCASCNGTGRKGRVVVAEILRVTPELDDLIAADAPRSALKRQIITDGFQSMAADGLAKMMDGEISFADLCRAVDVRGDR